MKYSFNRIATVTGLILGACALSAFAGTWNPPSAPPPGGNPDAPINVGTTPQNKLGPLGVKGLVTTDFTLATGTPSAGMVLTALDSLGNAIWAAPAGGSVGPKNYVIPSMQTLSSKSLTYYPCTHITNNVCDTFGSATTATVANIVAVFGGTFLYNGPISAGHFCSALFADAPYSQSYSPKTWSSPGDNGVLYWDSTKAAFVLRNANGMNNGVDFNAPFTCSSIETVTVN